MDEGTIGSGDGPRVLNLIGTTPQRRRRPVAGGEAHQGRVTGSAISRDEDRFTGVLRHTCAMNLLGAGVDSPSSPSGSATKAPKPPRSTSLRWFPLVTIGAGSLRFGVPVPATRSEPGPPDLIVGGHRSSAIRKSRLSGLTGAVRAAVGVAASLHTVTDDAALAVSARRVMAWTANSHCRTSRTCRPYGP